VTPETGIRVDASRCQGHGRCYALAPNLFAFDVEGYAVVATPAPANEADRQLADRAVDSCPEGAIFFSRDSAGG
jgi:ferredoxin